MEYSVRSPGEIRERCDSLSPCCVVLSDPLHCIYILCILRLLCLLEIVNSGGMLSGYCRHSAPAPWGSGPMSVCVSEKVSGRSLRQVDLVFSQASWECAVWLLQLPLSITSSWTQRLKHHLNPRHRIHAEEQLGTSNCVQLIRVTTHCYLYYQFSCQQFL